MIIVTLIEATIILLIVITLIVMIVIMIINQMRQHGVDFGLVWPSFTSCRYVSRARSVAKWDVAFAPQERHNIMRLDHTIMYFDVVILLPHYETKKQYELPPERL